MEVKGINNRVINVMNGWDPFGCGLGGYDPEIADVLFAVHELEDKGMLAKRIKAIYEYSFDMPVPYGKCMEIAEKLILLKNSSSCDL